MTRHSKTLEAVFAALLAYTDKTIVLNTEYNDPNITLVPLKILDTSIAVAVDKTYTKIKVFIVDPFQQTFFVEIYKGKPQITQLPFTFIGDEGIAAYSSYIAAIAYVTQTLTTFRLAA